MKQKRFSAKVVLSLVAALLIIGSMCTFAFAANQVANYNCTYGQAVPTNNKLSTKVSQYNFYGDEGTLYFMQISKGKPNAHYSVEIFSDSGYTTKIRSFSKQFSTTPGNTPLKITWAFKTTPSGTYYGRCYTYVETEKDGVKTTTVDTSSFSTFKININRVGTQTVKLKTLANSATGPKLTWETLPTATKYNVYRKASGDKSWTYLITLAGAASSYVDTTAKSGTTYTYTVKCSDGKYVSKYDTKGLTIKYLSAPKISVAGTGAAGNALIKWNQVPGATGYYIYRKGGNLSDYNWKLVATIKNGKTVSYTDKTATSTDWHYTYTVKAYSGKTVSAYNYNGVDFDYIKAPTIKRVSSYDGGMKIDWSSNNANVKGYYVYRLDGKYWKYIGKTTQKNYVDTAAVSNNKYTYTVKAYSDTNAGAYNAKGVTNKYLAAPKLKPLTFDSSYRSIVKWDAVAGANGYVVYRKINNAASWSVVATIKDAKTTYFYDSCKKASGNSYKYTVRAYDKNNLYSYFEIAGTSGVCLAKPLYTAQQAETEDNSLAIKLSWGNINGATKYNVYRRNIGGSWRIQQTVTDTFYIDKNIENGVTYEYAVRSFNDAGDYSQFYIKSATAITVPQINSVNALPSGFTNVLWTLLDGVDSYNVYRMPKDGTEWELLTNTTARVYKDSSEEATTTPYYYAVSSVIGELESAKSAPVGNFAQIKFTAAINDEEKGVQLDWECDKEINTASITRTDGTEEAYFVGGYTGDVLSDIDTAIVPGTTYTYTITVKVSAKVDSTASVTIRFPHDPLAKTYITRTWNATENNLTTIGISWLQVNFAEQYIVLRSSDDGYLDWRELATINQEDAINGEFTFLDNTAEPDVAYAYKIKAVAPKADRPESESDISIITIEAPLGDLTDLKAAIKVGSDNKEITLTWAPVVNAEKYTIYRTTDPENNDSWVVISEITLSGLETGTEPRELTDNTIEENGTYTYKVEAYSSTRGTSSNISEPTEVTGFVVEEPETTEPETTEPETTEPVSIPSVTRI